MMGGEGVAELKYWPPWLANDENQDWNVLNQSPKKENFDQNKNDSESHIWNSFF